MLTVLAKILAKNPPSILIVLGTVLYLMQNGIGVWMIAAGILLNVLWILRR